MANLLYFMAVWALAGLLATLVFMGLFHLYDRLPEDKAMFLKIMTLAPPLVLVFVGLCLACRFSFVFTFLYMLPPMIMGICFWPNFYGAENSFMRKLIGFGLLVTAALPFLLVGLTPLLERGQ